jgi:hypothetical protein
MNDRYHRFVFSGYSMYPGLRPRDIIVTKEKSLSDIAPGCILCMTDRDRAVVHRVLSVERTVSCALIVCKGDNLPAPDEPQLFSGNSCRCVSMVIRNGRFKRPRQGRFSSFLCARNLTAGMIMGRAKRAVMRMMSWICSPAARFRQVRRYDRTI